MWFRRKPLPEPTPSALEVMYEIQSKMLAQNQEFLVKMSELALSSAARTLGVRSARTRKRDAKGRLLPTNGVRASQCELCRNPMFPRPTIAMIDAHRAHVQEPEPLPEPTGNGNGNL